MTTASSRQESKKLNDAEGARVIISASGMMTGGRVLHHALRLVPNPDATIVFVGFQAAGTWPAEGWASWRSSRFTTATAPGAKLQRPRSEEHTSELQSPCTLV